MEIWKKMWVGVFFWTQCIVVIYVNIIAVISSKCRTDFCMQVKLLSPLDIRWIGLDVGRNMDIHRESDWIGSSKMDPFPLWYIRVCVWNTLMMMTMMMQVIFRVCAPISTWSADCGPTSWRPTCRVSLSFCCRGCPSGSTWSLLRRGPHSASSPFWPSRRRAAAYCAACLPALSRRRSTYGWPPVSCSCSAPLSSTRSSTLWLADRRQRRSETARR